MSRFTLSPRAALVVAAVVVVVALVVIVLGSRGSGAGGVTSVTGAASVGASAPAGGAAGAGAGAAGAGGAAAGAGAASASASAGRAGPSASASTSAAPSVVVHVLGAVAHAGVVTVPGGGRVTDALEAAGGASGDADLARLNLARPLVDGERLYVPRVGEVDVPQALGADSGGAAGPAGSAGADPGPGSGVSGAAGSDGSAASDVVDLNSADQAALETLPGIGPGLAQRILAWREEHGRFSAVEDLLDVSGIGDGRFAELQDRVRV
ncbi:helix-hairpin-helix domain-containing protein [Curtobacterium sp. SL109]|uniref:helix-hairpin-helix domain-containing protein n=1 Tax=Curtobacterium sp. SL109 TaxID=2994662 RepID=UPI002272A660|nr:helix-hairpin-helix domain-containing protein [Curtobacterium sp. SL109]MCY1694999.1 helix-hairpin-helix domain-containing protein [Curtobacterium sp. SL109]